MTFPILPTGLIRLKLREFLLEAALYRLALLQREAEVVEARSVDNALDSRDLPTLWNAIGPNKLDPNLHPQLRCHLVPLPKKKPRLRQISYPHLFPAPH
ncbi:hypothetical protein [Mesorhizobium sp. M4B.F.Ca.ET.089.01.1.1]|uniref:hypothetical protein n=1 Tax=Mesorhizobium sp. M4B.F.Ca.ET.089.01.1.1 TaxID=2496662 RepID=UPI00121D206F|nr:hypothetical protein [Mesorhizobium sp. M4B.F.Ca.ET.089.01.1.1]TIX20644.1 MAG: hypothetical protein E5V35_32080 [Mesorhizobium sp.]